MGSNVRAICKCGVDNEISIGGGMLTFKYIAYFPCLCEDCKDVVEVNLLGNRYKSQTQEEFERGDERLEIPLKDRKFTCPKCHGGNVIPYSDSRLFGIIGDEEVIRWGSEILTNGTYKCPKCDNKTLRFIYLFYMWD